MNRPERSTSLARAFAAASGVFANSKIVNAKRAVSENGASRTGRVSPLRANQAGDTWAAMQASLKVMKAAVTD